MKFSYFILCDQRERREQPKGNEVNFKLLRLLRDYIIGSCNYARDCVKNDYEREVTFKDLHFIDKILYVSAPVLVPATYFIGRAVDRWDKDIDKSQVQSAKEFFGEVMEYSRIKRR